MEYSMNKNYDLSLSYNSLSNSKQIKKFPTKFNIARPPS